VLTTRVAEAEVGRGAVAEAVAAEALVEMAA
jgi:hypothetical protein